MISRNQLTLDFRRSVPSAMAALDRGADRAAQAARRLTRETEPTPGGPEGLFIFAVLAVMSAGAIISALALIAFAPR